MSTPTFTKSGTKATTNVSLPKEIFSVEVTNHQLLKEAYLAYLANQRTNNAKVKSRGEVSGGGKKPWRQKGTGRARFGSTRNPIWRKGGVAFGPTGNENYSIKLNSSSKKTALKQALSLKNAANSLYIMEDFAVKDAKVSETTKLLSKVGATGKTLIIVSDNNLDIKRATRNIPTVKTVSADYLNVYDILNSDTLIITKDALTKISSRFSGDK